MNERYRFVRLLGNGGMAEVYLAMARGAEGFEKPVAVKRVLAHLASDEKIAQMFVAEARLSMHLHHQNIVQMLDVARNPQGLFLVMELVNGWDLDVVLRSAPSPAQPVPEALAAFIVGQVAAGLSHAYRQQVDGRPLLKAHRDVSPSNILLTVDGEVKNGDFGIARLEASNMTEPGTFKGKVAYAAPEAIRGEAVSHVSDQFSLGVVFHELLLGQLPFGRPDNVVRYSEALSRGPVPSLTGISPQLAPILRKMLSLKPTDRYGHIEEVGAAVAGFLSRCGKPASATELSRFLSSVSLPLPPQDLLREAEKGARPIPLTQVSDTLSSVPTLGPALVATEPRGPAFSMGTSSLEDLGEWTPLGPTLDETGQVHGKTQTPPQPAPVTQIPSWATDFTLETLRTTPPPLDLGMPPIPPEELKALTAEPRARARSRFKHVGIFFFLVIAIGGAASWAWFNGKFQAPALEQYARAAHAYGYELAQKARELKETATGSKRMHVLRIESDPPGALVEVDGSVIGRTPLVQENVYPERPIRVQLQLAKYRPWIGTFEGGKDAAIDAKLEP